MYRLINSLLLGDNRTLAAGQILDLETEYHIKPSVLAILEGRGAISKVSTPPLSVLPGWTYRATRLAKLGVNTVEALLKADTEDIATALSVRPETVETYKREARECLLVHHV